MKQLNNKLEKKVDLKIVVAVHKPYWMPDDEIYCPVLVGAKTKHTQVRQTFAYCDDQGENISEKNASFCELTALYWGWKNLQAEYLGLVHYRRYFSTCRFGERQARIAGKPVLAKKLHLAPVILPTKRHYWIETNYSQYVHAHHAEDLARTREILGRKYAEYLPAYEQEMQKTSGHRFNMIVMRRDLLDAYCTWLFDILFTLEQELDVSSYTQNDHRVFGFVAERLLDCWLNTNHINYTEMPVVNLENQHWLKKGTAFLRRKFIGKC